jgi:tetratricopeptide (TPR) repeat protein
MHYPDDAPALQPGTDYLLVVQDDATGRASAEDPAKGLGFQLLGEAERATVEGRRDGILALESLDEPARDLALAVYYAGLDFEGRGLWGEAWLLLESVVQTQDAPTVQLLMGDMAAAMKLPDEAEAAHRAALGSAEAMGDLESQAAAYAGLWRIQGDKSYLERALELYERLGDEDTAEALREESGQ